MSIKDDISDEILARMSCKDNPKGNDNEYD